MRIGSLFSGVGGLELGLEWAGVGNTVWQVESDPFCRAVLRRHWPETKIYRDVRSVSGTKKKKRQEPCDTLFPVDLVCGGFPCQDVSSAGRGEGLAGSRSGLWREFRRVVEELGPRWVVVENVASGAAKWVDAVRGDLERLDYETLPVPLSAHHVGAPHKKRARVFVIARARRGAVVPNDHRVTLRNKQQRRSGRPSMRVRHEGDAIARHDRTPRGGQPQPTLGRGVHGVSAGLDDAPIASTRPVSWPSGRGQPQSSWEPRRAVPASGIIDGDLRLRALGNAVIPECAEVIGHIILEMELEQRQQAASGTPATPASATLSEASGASTAV